MTQATKPSSVRHAQALLVLSSMLAAANWYFAPERAPTWAAAGILLVCLALALAVRAPRAAAEIVPAVLFAGGMMAVSLAVKLLAALGMPAEPDASRRATMVILGAFLAFTGNALPKRLTPLAELRCDGAREQAFQRFSGWTWVLTGLGFALAWLALPGAVAKPVSMSVLVGGMLGIATRLVRLRRPLR
jgi:hypothetical protein